MLKVQLSGFHYKTPVDRIPLRKSLARHKVLHLPSRRQLYSKPRYSSSAAVWVLKGEGPVKVSVRMGEGLYETLIKIGINAKIIIKIHINIFI